uniref:Uncharacterized protein n=1 Tax=Glossina pallidipes TaxID=7398 RepID=A0A1B0A4V8_GLOPL
MHVNQYGRHRHHQRHHHHHHRHHHHVLGHVLHKHMRTSTYLKKKISLASFEPDVTKRLLLQISAEAFVFHRSLCTLLMAGAFVTNFLLGYHPMQMVVELGRVPTKLIKLDSYRSYLRPGWQQQHHDY